MVIVNYTCLNLVKRVIRRQFAIVLGGLLGSFYDILINSESIFHAHYKQIYFSFSKTHN